MFGCLCRLLGLEVVLLLRKLFSSFARPYREDGLQPVECLSAGVIQEVWTDDAKLTRVAGDRPDDFAACVIGGAGGKRRRNHDVDHHLVKGLSRLKKV